MKKKSILVFLTLLIGVVILAFAINNVSTPKIENENDDNSSKVELVANSSELIEAINNAPNDYETTTTISLTNDTTLSQNITIKSGQIIEIVSEPKDFSLGKTDLGYTLDVNQDYSIILERQAKLILSTNVELISGSSIYAEEQHSSAPDFYASLEINDSLMINGGNLYTDYFANIDVNGSLNLASGIVGHNIETNATGINLANVNINEDAALIQIGGSISTSLEGDGIYVYSNSLILGLADTSNIRSQSASITSNLNDLSEGSYILNPTSIDTIYSGTVYQTFVPSFDLESSLSITSNINIFPFQDMFINAKSHISVSNSATFAFGGLIDGEKYYSAGTNTILFDGGANWTLYDDIPGSFDDANRRVDFVDGKYDTSVQFNEQVNYGRSTYSGTKATDKSPLIGVNEATLNIFRGIVLQNNYNTQDKTTTNPFAGGIGIYNNSTLNYYGPRVLYNANTHADDDLGGAGIGATLNSTINMYGGEINYNSLCGGIGKKSGDGAGINLTGGSKLVMSGGMIGYNHGDDANNADGGGIIARHDDSGGSSDIKITNGNIIGNFVKGYGGAICLWHSNVSITGGKVDGNRATFGGGIATSSNSQQVTVTLDKDEDGNLTEITNNTAYRNGTDTGYGGGVCVGNNNGDEFKRRQTVIVNDAYIANNTAIYGGGIANYSSAGSNNNKLILNGGTIINNKAYNESGSLDSSYGYGIYSIKAIANDYDTNHMVELSSGIRVDTSNNIVFARLNRGQTPIKVTGNLTTDGIVGLIRYADESYYNSSPNVVEFNSGVNVDLDKFLLDNANYKFAVKGKHLYISRVTENDAFAKVGEQPFSTLQKAMEYITKNKFYAETIKIMNNKAITSDDIISIPNGYNITIKGDSDIKGNSDIKTLSISPSFGASSTLFTIENGASLKLEDIIIDGNSSVSQGHLIIQNNGTFELSQNSKIINNKGKNGYASVIEVAYRAQSITNIYGEISGNFGDGEYGIIYLGHSNAILNVYDGAIIDNSTAESPIDDIILEAGTIIIGESNANSNNLAIGTIIKQGNGQIIANNLNGMEDNPINVSVNEVDYTRNRLIISVNDSNSANLANYSNYFNLINRHNQFDSLVYRDLSKGLVINNVLEIIVDFKDVWNKNGSNYQKGEYLDNAEINEDAFDSNKELNGENYNPNEEFDPDSVNLGGIAGDLSLRYPIAYHNGALVFNIDSSSQLSLEKVTSIVSRSGYNILDYVIHNGTQSTSSEYRSTTSSLDVEAFEGLDSIYLGVNWSPLNYVFEFNNGGLITANGNMGTQDINYTSIETTKLLANKYYATGFRFIGWKIEVSSEDGQKSYLQLNKEDVILQNETRFNRDTYLITDLQNGNNGNTTFVLMAQWESIFNGTNTINNVGTSSNTAFKIESKEALEIFAKTVNGEAIDNYYNAVVDKDGNLIYQADDYLTDDGEIYYFSLESAINGFDKVIGSNSYNFIKGNEIDYEQIIADGLNKHPFSGNFNGNNHTINLNITGNDNFVGLFGYTKGATISNLIITGKISGNVSVGGLVGFACGGTFDNIRNKATITYTGSNVGGIFGTYYLNNNKSSDNEENNDDNITGSIRNVYNEGNLSYNGGADGQLVDYASTWSESKILYYYPGTRVGGIIGQSWDVNLTNAYNAGSISAKYGVGGIIGTMLSSDEESRTNSIVTTAFNAGTVTATAGLGTKYLNYGDNVYQVNAYAGGIVGRIFGSATVNDAMNTNEATVSATWTGTYTENANGVTFTYSEQNPTIGGRGVGGIIGVTSIDINDAGGLDGGNKTISNVINTGKVSGWTHIGGIAGILAYSDLSYSINVANLEAKGTVSVGNGTNAFLGGLVGMGIAANLFSTAIFDGDITYTNYTDYTIQSIGDISANSFLGYDANNINSLKLSSSQIVCKPDNQKPSGLDSTFFESGWTWKTYDDDKYYYPQLVSFADTAGHNSTANVILNDKTVAELSKTAISLKQEGQDVTEEYKVDITLNLGNAVKLIDQSGNPITDSIEITVKNKNNSLDTKTIKFIINSNPNGYVTSIVAQGLSYIEYKDYIIDLSSIKASLNRIGYTFDDWYRDETFTEKFNNNLYLENNEIYVNWTTTEYQISYSNINAYVAGEVNLPTNYINIFTVNDNNFTLITNDDLKNGNDYIGNGAYDFVTWQYVIGTTPYLVDGFNIISENGEYFVQLVNDGQLLNIDLIPIKDLEFRMYCTPYSYSIKYELGEVNSGEQVTNNNRQTYTIEDEISFIEPEKTGYDFMGWYTTPRFEESSKITSIPRGTVGNRDKDLTLYAKFEEAEQRLTFDLNGGTLTETSITFNGNTYEIHYDNKDETNYILIKYKTPLIGFHDALIAIIEAPNNGTTASTITKTETGNEGTEVTDQDVMGPSNMRVYVNYTVTKYEITINPGQTNSQLSFANIDISNIKENLKAYEIKGIEMSDNNIIITAEYGSNLQLLLEYLQKALKISGNYVFNGYSNNPNSLSIYNLRIDGEQDNISIQFLWTLENYHLEILDVYNQIIITINNSNNYGVVNNEGILDIEKLKEYINENHNTLEGYTFDNKFTNLQGGEIDTDYSLKGYSTLIAKYKNNEYDVSFNKNYSIDDQNTFTETDYQNKKLTYDKVVPQEILSLKPTRNGYDFIGWSYERNGQPLTSSQIYNLIPEDGSETLYAIWEEATYVIQYEFIYDYRWDNTTVDVSNLAKNYVFNSEEIEINQTLVQTGYEFIGWSLDGEDPLNSVIINTTVAESASNKVIVIYGHFEINTYTLEFDADGGKFNNNSGKINITVYYNERFNANLPEVPTKTGYEFIGYDNQSVLQSLAQDINNIEGIVVKAPWQPAIYTVNFFADGSGTWSEEVAYNGEVTSIDKAKIEANHPGYELVGWSNNPDNPTLEGVKITNDVTFTAIFEETTYDLNITLAGCTGFKNQVLEQLKKLFGEYTNSTLNSNVYTFEIKYNSSLLGLYNLTQVTDDNGTTHYFTSLSNNVATMPNQSLDLTITYSSVEVEKISVTIVIVNGPSNASNITYEIVKNESNIQIPNPQYVGYNFIGWKTNNDDNITDINEYIKDNFSATSITVKAEYEIQKDYSITYAADLNSNIWQTKTEVAYGTTIIEALGEPSSIPGYIFAGWYYGDQAANDLKVTENLNSIVAKWEETDYLLKFTYKGVSINSTIYQFGNEFIVPTLSETNDTYSFGVTNYKYYLATYYIEDGSGTKHYLNDLFKSSANGNYIMGDLAEIAKQLGIEVHKENYVTYLTFILDPTAINYVINVENSDISVTFNVEDNNITINGTAPETKDFYEFAGIGITENNLLELNKPYQFSELIALFSEDDLLNRRITLTSFETPITYTINGEKTFDVEDSYVDISDLTYGKEGYKFIGWLINEDDTYHYNSSIAVELLKELMLNSTDGTITLIPKYEKEKYLVHFDTNGGSFIPSQTVLYGDKIIKPNDPTREGYTFKYWSNVINGSEFNFETTVSNDVTLYAVFEEKEYKINYYIDGNLDSTISKPIIYPDILNYVLENPTKEGYIFSGWKDQDGNPISNWFNLDIFEYNFYGTYEEITYNIEYEIEEGALPSGITIDSKENIKFSENIDLAILDTLNDGYKFIGWNYNDEIYETISGSILQLEETGLNITFIAVFEYTYTIKYNVDGATVELEPTSATIGKPIILPTYNGEKEGYIFGGWQINGTTYPAGQELNINLTSTPGEEVTLVAIWISNSFKVIFNSNGGNGSMDSQTITITEDNNYELNANTFVKVGYKFVGWATTSTATTPDYPLTDDEKCILTGNYEVNQVIQLFAVWEARSYTIKFSGEGTESLSEIVVSYDNNTLTFPTINSIAGKSFLGYEYEGKLYKPNYIIPNLISDLNEDGKEIILTAKWKDKTYYINTYINGALRESVTKSYDEMIEGFMPTLPTADKGYIYKGWYKDAEYNESLTNIDFKEDVLVYNLYAEYKEISYTLKYNVADSAQTIDSKQYDYFDEIILVKPTMNNGYIFKSWTYNDVEYELSSHPTGQIFNVIDGATITLDIKYDTYYKVIFNANNGTSDSFELEKTTNESLNINNKFKYPGYEFIGWNTNRDATEVTFNDILSNDLTTTPGAEVNVYAIWEVINYTINSEYSNLNIPTSINIESNNNINFNDYIPTKVGYRFSHYEDEYGNRIDDINDVINYAINNIINLKAIFDANRYTINYEYSNEYSTISVESQSVEYDELVTLATINITNNNYKFLYFKDKNGVKYYNGQTVSKLVSENNNSITLIAVYSFVITFEANGGSGTMPSIEGVVSNNAINVTLPANLFRRIGYTFAGWSTNKNENSDSSNLLEQGTAYSSLATPLYAIWKANTYNITYMNNLGEILGSDTYSYDDSKELMSIIEIQNNNPGYTISGWYNNSDCTGDIINEIEINSIGDKTYYLEYVAKDFKTTITINSVPIDKVSDFVNALNAKLEGCAKVSETSSSTVIVTITTKYNENRDSINELFKESYEYTISNVTHTLNSFKLNDDNLATPSENVDLPLEFVTSKIVVNLYYYTSIDKEAQSLGQFELKNDFVLIADMLNDRLVSITGYKGIGWKDSIDGADYSFGNTLTESISLYYYYEAIKFNISYDGASASKVTYGQVFAAGLDINGARFIGWSKEQNSLIATYKAGDKLDVLQANEDEIISLYSVYDYYELVVVLESNNGDNETLELKYSYAALTNLTSIPLSFSYIGHTFTKWTNKAGGSDLVVNSLANLIQNGDAEITLVANWSKNTYSIVYVGANITTSLSYEYGKGLDRLPSPEASENIGFTFSGWYDKANPSETDTEITSISNEEYGDKIYYANWTPNHYKIYFSVEVDTSGRDDILTDENGKQYLEVIYSEEIGALPNPKETHDFSGWRYDDGAISGGDIYRWAQDIIITPNNEGLTYNVVIDLAGGSLNGNNNVINITASYNTAIETVLENAFGEYEVVKAGYKYDGYSVTDDATTITKDTVITIKWKLLTYTINYNYDNNKEIIVYDITKGDVSLLNPAKTGYTFNGWYQNNTFKGEQFIASNIDFVSLTDNEEIDLYAKFDPNNYHITFDLDGGLVNNSETISDLEVTYDANIPTLTEPSKLGYTFNGWYYGSTKITTNMAYRYAYDITVVARWSVNTYTITYDLGDANSSYKATNASGNITSYNVLMANINLLAPTREHYEFLYWTIDGNEVSEIDTSLAENITVTAVWKAKEYTIKYILLDEDIEPTTYTVETNNITLLNVDNKDKDYAFKGWYLNSDLSGDAVTEILPSSAKDYILYAKLEFTITINYNYEGVANGTINVIYNNAIEGLPTTSSVNGKKLIGFVYNNSEVNNGDIYLYDTNITIIAKYEDYKVTIEYDANGAAGNIGSQTIDYSNIDSLNLPSTGLTYRGHDFAGWSYNNININYQNNNFDAGALDTFKEYLKTLIVNSNSNISIKAIWNAKIYNITYNNVENATNNNPTSYTYSLDTIVTIERPIKTGYNFIGWTINNDTNKMLEYVIAVDTIGDITLTANFELINYQINYEGIEGITNTNPATYNIEEEVIVNPINKLGYTFLGWTKDGEAPKETYKIVKGTTGDITLTANWQANTYNITLDANDGSIENDIVEYTYGSTLSLATPIREGYTFIGWTYEYEEVTKEVIANNAILDEDGNHVITILANWEINDYTLTITISDVHSEQISSITGKLNNLNISNLIISYSNTTITITISDVQYDSDITNILNSIKNECVSYDILDNNGNKIEEHTFSYIGTNINHMPAKNVSIEAKYAKTSVYVYFKDNSNVESIKVSVGSTINISNSPLVPNPSLGYYFAHWSDNENGDLYDWTTIVDNTITLYTVYKPITYTIKFNTNNDTIIADSTYIYDTQLSLTSANKKGYNFINWVYNNEVVTKEVIADNALINSDDSSKGTITIEAIYKSYEITIKFTSGIGEGNANDITISYTDLETENYIIKLPTNFTKLGYTFNGFTYGIDKVINYEDNNFISQSDLITYLKDLIATSDNEITLTASYKANTYSITFNYNYDSNKSNTITVLYDQYSGQLADEISKLYKYGYEFTNWTFNEDIITTIAEIAEYATYNEENKQYEITLDAKYNLKSDVKIVLNVKDVLSEKSANIVSEINNNLKGYNFTIVEESNDSNIVNIVVTIIGTYQTELELLNLIDINKEYEVNGITYKLGSYDYRYEDSNISSETYPYNYDEIPGEDVIVDVRYITNKILVYLNIDGETHKELEPTINEDGTYTLTGNEEELKLTPPTGYVWDGKWYSDSSYVTEYQFGKTETEVIELHAKYEPISYNIKFNANEGTLNDSETKSFTYDVEVKLDVNNPTKVGYTFTGWSYNGKIYTKDSIVNNLTSIDNDTIEFVASWVANTYTIIFDADGGITSVPSKEFTYNNAETLNISDPTKDGYIFTGWSYNGDTYQSDSEIKNLATEGEITFVATWEVITYTVVYDNNGGNGSMAEQTFTYDKYEALNANAFTKTGYTFIGWNTNKDATTALYNDLEVVGNLASTTNEEIRLYAIWQVNTYTITFNLNGGNVVNDIADINLNYGQTKTLNVEEPTRTGYIFGGWSYNGNTYNNDDELSNLTDINNAIIEFVAIWNPITYQVQFVDGDNVATIDLTYDKYYQINITNPSKVGYNFTHWSDKDNNQYVFSDILFNLTETNGDIITLTANYEIINYNISYILNGSNISGSYDRTYNVEDENINLPTPTLAGYDFDGWYDESLNNEFNYIQGQITGDLILYAKFIPNEYKISFNTKDSHIEDQTFADVMISYNSKFGDKLPIPKAEFGITFHYWYYLDGDDKVIVNNNTIYDFTNDLVLYAYTEVTNYNIVYETNGGVNSDKNITNLTAFDVADGKTINIYSPTKAGYTFVGWYLDSNFNGDKIDVIDTALIENNINNVIRLYAKYEVHKFNINFYNGDTTNLISSIEVSYGQKIKPITTPQKEGYIFDNWYLDGISIYDFNSPVISDLNIIALYKITEVKLSANINGELVDVVVTSIDGKGLQADTRIIIELVTDSNIINSSNELLTEFGRISRLYNIKLVDANGNTIQPEGQVRIALTLPNEELKGNERFSIVNIKDDISGYTLFDSNSEDGTITFNTTHFSYYGIIITDKIVDWTWLWVLLGVVAFILLQFLIVLLIKNRRFRIRFISKGDVKIRELKYKKDEKVSLPKPQRLGYRFVGWYLDSEFKHPAHITTMPNENLILYARWQEDPLTIGLIVKNRKK